MSNPTLNEIKVDNVLYKIEDTETREKVADIIKYKTMTKEQFPPPSLQSPTSLRSYIQRRIIQH